MNSMNPGPEFWWLLCGLVTLALAIWGACHAAWWLVSHGVRLCRACTRARLRDLIVLPRYLATRIEGVRVPQDGRPLADDELATFGRVLWAWHAPAAQPQVLPAAAARQDDDDAGGAL